jgi:hypothetical protein
MAVPENLATTGPFAAGAIVLVTLNHPREKYWGAVQAVNPAGVALRGVDLNSFDDFIRQLKAGEPVAPHTVFFPMHRVERMELDARNADIPSLQERFEAKAGRDCATLFAD